MGPTNLAPYYGTQEDTRHTPPDVDCTSTVNIVQRALSVCGDYVHLILALNH